VIRYWNAEKGSGLAVADTASIGGAELASSVMPAAGDRLALSVSKAMTSSASVSVGAETDVEITSVG
jgi:hypothetical protein